jgi:hypothetical protein
MDSSYFLKGLALIPEGATPCNTRPSPTKPSLTLALRYASYNSSRSKAGPKIVQCTQHAQHVQKPNVTILIVLVLCHIWFPAIYL